MRHLLLIVVFLSSILNIEAQNSFYYYHGNKIPLLPYENKVCVSVKKQDSEIYQIIRSYTKIDGMIEDERFYIFVLLKPEYEKLSLQTFWKDVSSDVILTPCYLTMENEEIYTTPYLNVRLKKEQDLGLLKFFSEMHGLEVIENVPSMPLWYILAITSSSNENPIDSANAMWESGAFSAAIADFCSNDISSSMDPMFNYQWGLQNDSNPNIDISACPAWNYATGKGVTIAILDSGVDLNHIDLVPNISNSYDTESFLSPSVVYGDHATHCAGIAAAVKDNGIFIAGVSPDASIVSISNRMNESTNSRLKRAEGISWAYKNGVDVISNSWTSTPHPAIDEALDSAFTYGRQGKGCVVLFASGNTNSDSICYPAKSNDLILTVGAIDANGTRASFSNYGDELDIVAPGVRILSTLPDNSVGIMNGTSMACPYVAGVAALILERNPNLTVNQVNNIICVNAKKIAGVNFDLVETHGTWTDEYGYGLVDAYGSVMNTPHSVFIQNETVTGMESIIADSIYVGKNVLDRKQFGPVTLGPGNITFKADYVELRNSTVIPLNTTLSIDIPQ